MCSHSISNISKMEVTPKSNRIIFKYLIVITIFLVILYTIGFERLIEISLRNLCGDDMTTDVCFSLPYSQQSKYFSYFDNLLNLNTEYRYFESEYHTMANDSSAICILNQTCPYDHMKYLEEKISKIFYHENAYHRYLEIPTIYGTFHTHILSTQPAHLRNDNHKTSNRNVNNENVKSESVSHVAKEIIEDTTTLQASKTTLILFHGYSSASTYAWRNTLNHFIERYDVIHAVDLPGFGRSLAPELLYHKNTTEYDVINIYCEWFNQLFHTLNLTDTDSDTDTNDDIDKSKMKPKPYIVAHSFGGTLATHCLSRNQSLASRLLLADAPGTSNNYSHQSQYKYK